MLKISPSLSLPIEAVTEKLAFLGRTGSGKTYAAQLLAELMHGAGAQIIVLDPVGVWWSLRLGADGKAPGLAIPVFGGLHGDVPLEASGGALIANLIVDRGISAVIDVSQFEHDTDKAKFARAFADRFFFRKKADPSAVHVFIEECQEFMPQNPMAGDTLMLHAFTRMTKIGRNFGIGMSMLSQRPQEVNKKCLNLAEILLCFQLTGPHERKTVEGWIADKGIKEDIAGELPKLEVGHPHIWSPALLKTSRVVPIARKQTFDASSTPKVGKRAVVRELSPIDMAALRTEMAATIERAKANDPKELKRTIAELQKKLKLTTDGAMLMAEKFKEMKPAADADLAKRYESEREEWKAVHERQRVNALGILGLADRTAMQLEQVLGQLNASRDKFRKLLTEDNLVPVFPRPSSVGKKQEVRPITRAETMKSMRTGAPSSLGAGERRVLTAIAQHGSCTREQLTVLTGYKRSSRDTYIQRLKAAGFVEQNGERIDVLADGVRELGPDFEPLPTGQALYIYWLERLPVGEKTILGMLGNAYPRAVPRDELSEDTGYKRSSRDTYIQRLRSRELIEIDNDGVRAARELMES